MGYKSTVEALPPTSSSVVALRCSAAANNTEGVGILEGTTEEADQPPEPANPHYQPMVEDVANICPQLSDDDVESMSSTSSVDEVKSSSEEEVGLPRLEEESVEISFSLPDFGVAPTFSYVNPKIALKRSSAGVGMFANTAVKEGEVLIVWSGKVVHLNTILAMRESDRHYILQIDEELFQIPPWKGFNEPADFTNHSCDPNSGFKVSPITLAAMRHIAPGEEISFDYAMCESIDGLKGNEFECCCGTRYCRGSFTGHDWKNPELWARYGEYFSPYLKRKIEQYRQEMNL